MRDTITVTVTEITGSRFYRLPRKIKTILAVSLFGATCLLVGSMVTAGWLLSENTTLDFQNGKLKTDLKHSVENRQHLDEQLSQKTAEFQDVGYRMRFIEEMIGSGSLEDRPLLERVNHASIIIDRREKEFREIGDMIDNIEGIIGLESPDKKNHTFKERLQAASLTALQKQTMLNEIPSGMPIISSRISSGFGHRKHPVLKKRMMHAGIDFKADVGTNVTVTADGVVEFAGKHKKSGFGNLVIVRHNFGFRTFYGHLSGFVAKAGDFVHKGDLLAKSGNTGISSGPHLHYEIRFIHRSLNPKPFINWSMDNYEVVFKEKQVKWDSLIKLANLRLNAPAQPSLHLARK
ncbi:MAG: M23 family metallopeptidase [Magnetococcales bacterium]|nr:M23 family metallopeptidase [Magnetococcales bacterium]